ncbi:hypothetical protein BU16DRAFT_365276 [Lophium mytilinum]|uniref:Uncharacterized protein n=1 Tax=Lophium mytilinum TaxID=390894 RepID=A0A6A6QUG3_9PEZI|nr:hypothetical protein BU16DRAFT_365276 [Lophium mytilinum]
MEFEMENSLRVRRSGLMADGGDEVRELTRRVQRGGVNGPGAIHDAVPNATIRQSRNGMRHGGVHASAERASVQTALGRAQPGWWCRARGLRGVTAARKEEQWRRRRWRLVACGGDDLGVVRCVWLRLTRSVEAAEVASARSAGGSLQAVESAAP